MLLQTNLANIKDKHLELNTVDINLKLIADLIRKIQILIKLTSTMSQTETVNSCFRPGSAVHFATQSQTLSRTLDQRA